ncbi:MAG: ADP-ribosylation/Crystallin J1 [Monoraphidium minutum]|nr:MAG: ADP-ribosylation/Crystallin J1 [Monoraphidium minutum]
MLLKPSPGDRASGCSRPARRRAVACRAVGRPQQRRRATLRAAMEAKAAPSAATNAAEVEQEIKRLEKAAMDAHLEAQALNKQQKFEEAQAKYADMRVLDARALDLTNSLGCPSCAVADAAATGVQWIYSLETLDALLAARRGAEGPAAGLAFLDPPQSPFLPGYGVGRASPYGEETLVLLRSLAAAGGLDCRAYAAMYAGAFGEGFDGYRNAATTGFLRNHSRGMAPPASGAEDAQANCVARLAPLVAAFAGHPNFMRIVAAATRTTQNTDEAEAWACAGAAVLEALIVDGCGAREAVERAAAELGGGSGARAGRGGSGGAPIAGHLRRVLELRASPHAAAVDALGRNCHMPNAGLTPLHAALHQEWLAAEGRHASLDAAAAAEAAFVDGIEGALAAGGCCASRAGFAGACLGAALGGAAVPAAWRGKAGAAGEVAELFAALNAARGGGGSSGV